TNGTTPDATLQTTVTVAAAAETPAQIITRICGHYVATPTPDSFTDCSGKDLTGADLTSANLHYTNLTGANLTNAKLTNATLDEAELTNANLHYTNLTGANLGGTNLTGAKLTNANLTNTNLTGANLTNAKLYYTNLTGAKLTNANLNQADLTGVDLTGANLSHSSVMPTDITVAAESADGTPATWTTPTPPTGLHFIDCDPPSGTIFPHGISYVTCDVSSIRNSISTTGSGTFTITVTAAPIGAEPPTTGSLGSLGSSFFGFGS
ncbi:pentapeptide repeat-containing protein, partial [Rhodococcus sp. IEGM 1379]|uniref:pentapeptide repeat-containing protein n=1 Tax=Rhodococcus sp. IEGM 1379 TaxID=3047086 RepID=UPI0024B7A8E8